MKKLALVLTFGLLLQIVPVKGFASETPAVVPEITGGVIAALVTTFLILTDGNSSNEAKATGNEFTDLNNKPGFTSLLKQMAGGSLNTVEILK